MSYFETYQRKAVEAGYVDQEGDYMVKIRDVESGQLTTGERYTRVICDINYKNRPSISIFLTEGKNFDGNVTAFIDSFDIKDLNNTESWKGHYGWIHILLKKKDGFTNMVHRWLLGDNGFVREEVKKEVQRLNSGTVNIPSAGNTITGPDGDEYGDFPF